MSSKARYNKNQKHNIQSLINNYNKKSNQNQTSEEKREFNIDIYLM